MVKRKYVTPENTVLCFEVAQMLATSINTNIDVSDNDAIVGGEGDDALGNQKYWDDNSWE